MIFTAAKCFQLSLGKTIERILLIIKSNSLLILHEEQHPLIECGPKLLQEGMA